MTTHASTSLIPWRNIALLMQIFDLVTFLPAVLLWGIGGESNLLMVWVHEWGGIYGVIGVKTLGIAGLLACILALESIRSRLTTLALLLIGIIGLLGTMTNIAAIAVY